MLNTTITWNGVSSDTLGIRVERFPNLNRPQRKYEQVSVPGRNGDLFFFQDAWNNYEQAYDIFAGNGQRGNSPEAYAAIMQWLYPAESSPTIDDYINLTVGGYHRLIDSNEPNSIRLATFSDSVNIENSWNRRGQATLQFNCRPERFTADAFTALTKTSATSYVTNPTIFGAKPFIKVYGSGDGVLTVNGYAITITGMADYLHIDCEQQNCYRLLAENRNNLISLANGFPVLKSGSNTITRSGGITSFEITPRWWRL